MDTSQDLELQVWKTLLLTKNISIDLNNLDIDRSWQNFYDFTEICEKHISKTKDYSKLKFNIIYFSEGTLFLINDKWWPEAIHNFCSKNNFPIENITFTSSCFALENTYQKWKQLFKPDDNSFNIKTKSFGLNLYSKPVEVTNKSQRQYKFNCLNGRMVGARQVFMKSLWENNLLTKDVLQDNIVSFHYHNDLDWDIEGIDIPEELKNICPIEFDIENNSDNYFNGAEKILYKDNFCQHGDYSNIYSNSYVSVVSDACETTWISNIIPKLEDNGKNEYFNKFYDEMFISEKTSRTMLYLHPFIIFGTNNVLSTLRKLGFETFGDFWNEDYDTKSALMKLNIICKNMHEINEMTTDELDTMYNKMLPILEHNRDLLITRNF